MSFLRHLGNRTIRPAANVRAAGQVAHLPHHCSCSPSPKAKSLGSWERRHLACQHNGSELLQGERRATQAGRQDACAPRRLQRLLFFISIVAYTLPDQRMVETRMALRKARRIVITSVLVAVFVVSAA